jgi:hypothetical protein
VIDDRVGLAPERRAELEALARAHRTLEDVVRWGALAAPPALVREVVTQDEFTHDVIVPWRELYLVYDTT